MYVNLAHSSQLQETYDEDVRFYFVSIDPFSETPYTDCRRFAQLYDTVIDTMLLESRLQGYCYWDGTYVVPLSQELTNEVRSNKMTLEEFNEKYPEIWGEDSILEQSKEGYQEWLESYKAYIAENKDSTKTDVEKMQEMSLAGISDTFSVTMRAYALAEDFYKEHQDQVSMAFPGIVMEDIVCEYQTFSAWEHVGDLNEDDSVNALDASIILSASVAVGAGSEDGLTIEEQQFADINMDGVFNAEDAAIILQYSAAIGSGNISDNIQEYLQNK